MIDLDDIFRITVKEQALEWKEKYLKYIQERNEDEIQNPSEKIVNDDIGYLAGYGTYKERERIEELFECSHPIFGKIKEFGVPTLDEVLECGKQQKTLKEIRNGRTKSSK